MLTISAILFLSKIPNQVNTVNAADFSYSKVGLGYSINAVKSKYIDVIEIRDGSPIMNEDWLASYLENITPTMVNYSDIYSFSASSFEEINTAVNMRMNFSSSIKGDGSIFTANAQNGFDVTSGINYSSNMSQYYYILNSIFEKYTYTLPNYSSNLSLYIENLHPDYIKAVKKFFVENNQKTANEFFDSYGTHLIAKGVYGGKLEAYYSAVSNKIDVGGKLKNTITQSLNAGILKKMETGVNMNFDLSSAINQSTEEISELFRTKAYGGTSFSATNISTLNLKYEDWCGSIQRNPTLIRTSSDGLVPLWNLLPKEYNSSFYKDKMLSFYNSYVKTYNSSIDNYYNKPLSELKYETEEKSIRKATYKITDSGRFNHNKHDLIYLDDYLNYSIDILESYGFKKVDVKVKLQVREVHRGYQYICLYNYDGKSDDYKIHNDFKFEYNGNSLGTTFGWIEHTFSNISIDKLSAYKKLVIRYGASGSQDDDWENKDLYLKLIFKK